jgi:hypothetical protein
MLPWQPKIHLKFINTMLWPSFVAMRCVVQKEKIAAKITSVKRRKIIHTSESERDFLLLTDVNE